MVKVWLYRLQILTEDLSERLSIKKCSSCSSAELRCVSEWSESPQYVFMHQGCNHSIPQLSYYIIDTEQTKTSTKCWSKPSVCPRARHSEREQMWYCWRIETELKPKIFKVTGKLCCFLFSLHTLHIWMRSLSWPCPLSPNVAMLRPNRHFLQCPKEIITQGGTETCWDLLETCCENESWILCW